MKRWPKRGIAALLPTRGELRILQALWETGEGTVDQVVRRLPSSPPANYKTVQTILGIMEQKGLVRHKTLGRAFVFSPCVTREEMARLSVRSLFQQKFVGSPAELVINMLEDSHVDETELKELEALIRRFRTERKTKSSG
jgi:BlaI family penicillinase repressor